MRLRILLIAAVSIVMFASYFSFNFYVAAQNAQRLNQVKHKYLIILEKLDAEIATFAEIEAMLEDAVLTGER